MSEVSMRERSLNISMSELTRRMKIMSIETQTPNVIEVKAKMTFGVQHDAFLNICSEM
jgi:hypothetical protein